MAFNPERLSLLVQPVGDGGIRFYSYPTDDAEATVTAAGYATNAADYGLRTYDLIFVTPVNGAADTYILAVDAIDADGHATLASPGPIGDLIAANNLSDLTDVAAALVNLGGLTYIRGSDKVTPYDYGASSSDAYSTDHAVAVQAMVDAARATYDTDTNTFKKVIDLAGRMWTVGTSIDLTNLRQAGLVIKNGGLHGTCSDRPVLDLAGTQGVRFEDVFISGDETSMPSCAVLISRALFGAIYTGGAGLHDLTGLTTAGMFLHGAVLNLGGEDIKYPIRACFNRRKGTGGGSSVISICSDYAYFNTWFGTDAIQSDYATLPPTGTKLSCLGHEWLSIDARRPSPWGAPAITSITQSATSRLTLTTAPTAGATITVPASGDATFFFDIAGMTELNGRIIYISKVSDTEFDLYTDAALTTPLDTTAYGAFTSGSMWGASGPALRFGGFVNNVYCPTGYLLNYGWGAVWFDSRHETGASSGMTNVTLGFQHEAEPRWSFFAVTPDSVTVVYEDFDLEVNGIGVQNWATACFFSEQTGTGKITFKNSKMRFQNMTSNPQFGVFGVPTTFNMKNVELTFGLAAAWDGETAFNTPFTGIVHTDDDGVTREYGTSNRVRVLAQSAVAATHTGDTTETTLATISIPAGLIGTNGAVRLTTLWTVNNDANAKTARVRLSTTAYQAVNLASNLSAMLQTTIRNRGATNSQVANAQTFGSFGATTTAVMTGGVNTALAQDLTITAQLGDAADTMTLEAYTVELLQP